MKVSAVGNFSRKTTDTPVLAMMMMTVEGIAENMTVTNMVGMVMRMEATRDMNTELSMSEERRVISRGEGKTGQAM